MDDLQFKYEYREVSRVLEKFHAIFYKMWEYGSPELNDQVPTACLKFNPKSYKPLRFCFNPKFWKGLDIYSRSFLVAHECLHALLNHGVRTKNLFDNNADKESINVALDLAVNHMLVNSFGFERKKIPIAKDACWVDTVFKKEKVSSYLSFEEYYNLLTQSEYTKSTDQDLEQILKSAQDSSRKSESSELKSSDNSLEINKESKNNNDSVDSTVNIFDDHSSLLDISVEELIESMKSDLNEYDLANAKEKIDSFGAGDDTSGIVTIPDVGKLQPTNKWENIVKKWRRIGYNIPEESIKWTKINRRYAVLPDDIILPSDDDSHEEDFCISKLNAWIFLDVSGSCMNLKEHFFMAYETIPEKRFNKRIFGFGTYVHEIKSKNQSINAGGGTSFAAVSQFVDRLIDSSKVAPDIIMVITDGDAEKTTYTQPEKWHWFLSAQNPTHIKRLPAESHVHNLKDYFRVE